MCFGCMLFLQCHLVSKEPIYNGFEGAMTPKPRKKLSQVDLDLETPEEAELRVSVEAILKKHAVPQAPEVEEEPPLLLSPF